MMSRAAVHLMDATDDETGAATVTDDMIDVHDDEDEEEDVGQLLSKALPISADIEMSESGMPMSGEDYLLRVMQEARACPQVVSTQVRAATCNKQTVGVSELVSLNKPAHRWAASLDWQRQRIALFGQSRERLRRVRAQLAQDPAYQHCCKLDLAGPKDSQFWRRFCLGSTAIDKHCSQEQMGEATPPLLSVLVQLDQPRTIRLLELHVSWLLTLGLSASQGQWMYALLSALEKPVDGDTCATLRQLARFCMQQRDKVESEDDVHLGPCNLFIAIVSRYFDQMDLVEAGS